MIGQGIGQVLPQAIGIAISPAPIILVIVVMFSNRALLNAGAFLAGWAVSILAVFLIVYSVADGADVSTDAGASNGQATVQIVLGLLFLLLAVRQWRNRPAPGVEPQPPAFLEKIKSLGPALAFGLALLFTVANPKNLPLLVSAGAEVAQLGVSGGDAVIFLLITMVGVAAPVVVVLVMGDRSRAVLQGWQDWQVRNQATVMIVLFLVLAAKMLGSGIGTLSA